MSESRLVDVAGRGRSPAATPGHRARCAPPNKGVRYPRAPAVRGIASCMDSDGTPSPRGRLDTSTVGAHLYTVTAINSDRQRAAAQIV